MKAEELTIGYLIWFHGERRPYRVRATDGKRFAICTKPFNVKRTVLYTIIDWEQGVRGTENLVFGFGAETDEQCWSMLERLTAGDSKVSRRNRVLLDISGFRPAPRRRSV